MWNPAGGLSCAAACHGKQKGPAITPAPFFPPFQPQPPCVSPPSSLTPTSLILRSIRRAEIRPPLPLRRIDRSLYERRTVDAQQPQRVRVDRRRRV
jgi:hypothetical protein